MEQPPATTPQTSPAPAPANRVPPGADRPDGPPGFAARGRLRRRLRFLRKARELAYRDLGGLVFNLHRFGTRNDQLVLAKLGTLGQIDGELRAIERALGDQREVAVLREAGVTACPRCAAIHGSEDRFCPACGLPVSRHEDLPIAGPASPPAPPPEQAAPAPLPAQSPAAAPAPAPARPPDPQATAVHPVVPPTPASAPERGSAGPGAQEPPRRQHRISPWPRGGA